MGILRATGQAIGGGFADAWLETIEPDNMGEHTVFTKGVLYNRGLNKKGTQDTVSNGSIILMHTLTDSNSEALPIIIEKLREKGYVFSSLLDFK